MQSDKLPHLEAWEWDGSLFTGFIYGLEHFGDGDSFATTVNFVDWPAKRILVGKRAIELGASRDELNYNEEDDTLPW